MGIVIDPHLTERSHRCRRDNILQESLRKLRYVAERCDKVIICGDLFHIYSNSTAFYNIIVNFFMEFRGKFDVIPGNHDCFGRNATLGKTTLGSLYYSQVLPVHFKPWKIGGVTFVPMPINADPKSYEPDADNKKILIAHKFYDQAFTPEESLFSEDIKRLNYYMAFLGHDHKPYDEKVVGNTTIIRMGSLTRIDTQCYNLDREICYYELTISPDSEWVDYERKVIPSTPTIDCYTENGYLRLTQKTPDVRGIVPRVSFMQIGDAISKLTKREDGSVSLDKVLRRIETPQNSIADIKARHELNNIQYT